ncbi:MAG: TldD/PmbA family protein [Candidatus Dormibacteria bacterium]
MPTRRSLIGPAAAIVAYENVVTVITGGELFTSGLAALTISAVLIVAMIFWSSRCRLTLAEIGISRNGALRGAAIGVGVGALMAIPVLLLSHSNSLTPRSVRSRTIHRVHDLIDRVLDLANGSGAGYADCRVVERTVQHCAVKDGAVAEVNSFEDSGVGVRVVVDGGWGFASTDRVDAAGVTAMVVSAVRIARASARVRHEPVRLAPTPVVQGRYETPVNRDPFSVSIGDKLGLLMDCDAAMSGITGISTRQASVECVRETRYFGNSEGTRTEQVIIESGGGLDATATSTDEVQTRSYPNSFGRHQLCAGWEAVEAMALAENAEAIAHEAVALLTAEPCPTGRMTLILDPTQAALQVHESCGHPTELDRALGDEAAYAGTSFLEPPMLDSFRYGSEAVTITADATRATGLGTFGWDDEGVAAQRTTLVDRGLFTGYMTSRETAARFEQPSNGTMRAEAWNRIPLIRMTNVNLEAGDSSLEEMVASTERGVYLQTNRSWSIDDRRLNFQFGTQNGWEIRDGKRVRLVKNALYSGRTPDFWNSCDAVAGPAEWSMWGVVNCGKGQPGQVLHVGHGAASCRFQNVAITGARG